MRDAVRPCSSTDAFSDQSALEASHLQVRPARSHMAATVWIALDRTDAHSSPLGNNGPKMLSSV
jgi:hypothetical protein